MITEKSEFAVSAHDFRTKSVGIKESNLIHLASLFSDDIYSDKPLALIREYSANAYDANIAAGKPTTPIHITLPSEWYPQLKIRDFGNGLSQDEMDNIYASIGESTKRNSNTEVGCFGLGCKAGYSYGTRSFMVISYNNGVKTVYNCVKSEVSFAEIITLTCEPSTEPSGLEVIINIQKDDINTFRNIAFTFFKYWDVMPTIEGFSDEDYKKIRGTDTYSLDGTNWALVKNNGYNYGNNYTSVAVMGNIAYPINWRSVKGYNELVLKYNLGYTGNLDHFLKENNWVFRFNIGEVKMAPNREALQYTELTNKSLLARIELMLSEVLVKVQTMVDTATNVWDAKKIFDTLFQSAAPLHRMREIAKVTYKGIEIKDNRINGLFAYPGVLKTYNRRSGNSYFYGYDASLYNWNHIECAKGHMILEIDQIDKVYIQKAVRYLNSINGVTTIYTLTFKDAAQRAEMFAKFSLDEAFITKYTSISDEVKKTIVRTGNTAKVPKPDDTIRALRYFASDAYSRYYSNGVGDLPTDNVDLTVGGIYMETEKNVIQGMDFSAMTEAVKALGKLEGKKLTVYFIGQHLADGKLMRKGKWIKFTDYLKDKKTELLKNDTNLKMYATFRHLLANAILGSRDKVFVIDNSEFVDFLSTPTLNPDFKALHNIISVNSPAYTIIKHDFVTDEADVKTITDLYERITTNYPLFSIIKNGFRSFSDCITAVTNYLK